MKNLFIWLVVYVVDWMNVEVLAVPSVTVYSGNQAISRSSSGPIEGLDRWKVRHFKSPASIHSRKFSVHKDSLKLSDGFPFLFRPSPSESSVICLSPKSASTVWNLAIVKALPTHTRFHNLTENPHQVPLHNTLQQISTALADAKVPRIRIVRNPYSRLLSGYIDKFEKEKMKAVGFDPNSENGFFNFLKALTDPRRNSPVRNNIHFALQSKICSANYLRYDYYLPVEQIDDWYTPLVEGIGLQNTVSSGWNLNPNYYKDKDKMKSTRLYFHSKSNCFYTSARVPCAADRNVSSLNNEADPTVVETFHATGSDKLWKKYYNNPEVIQLATNYARKDLDMFGYPEWDGIKDPLEYLSSLRDFEFSF